MANPQDNYNPVPQVNPSTQMPFDYNTVRATGEEFGAQIGQAEQGLAKTIGEVGQEAKQNILQYQGLLNEHEANTADMSLAVQGGQVYDSYKQLEGMAAANAKDKAVQDYLAVNDKIRASISNPAAQRAYDALATRRMSFTIQDMNSYAADQTKKAVQSGFTNSMNLAIDSTSRFNVADDPTQFGYQLGTIYHNLNALFTDPTTGKYRGLDVTQNKDGTLSFNTDTQEGRIAQADYDTNANVAIGKAWLNRAYSIAFDPVSGNITKAVQLVEANQGKMPQTVYNQLVREFHSPYMSELARSGSDKVMSDAYQEYQSSNGITEKNIPNNAGNVKTAKGDAFLNPATPVDGVIATVNNLKGELYKGKSIAQIAETWTGEPDKAAAWANTVAQVAGIKDVNSVPNLSDPKVVSGLVKGIITAEKGQGDRKLFSDDAVNQGVQSAFSGKQANLTSTPSQSRTQGYVPFTDYLQAHSAEIIQKARDEAANLGYDVTVQDEWATRTQTRINEQITQKNNQVRASKDYILGKVTDDNNPITNPAALDYTSDPTLKQNWIQLQAEDPYGAQAVRNIIQSNAAGRAATYGTDFYSHLTNVLNGTENDPAAIGNNVTGPNGPLTVTGYKALSKELQFMHTPEGQAFAHQELEFFKGAYGVMTGTSLYPGINPAYTKAGFDKFIMEALPQIQAGRTNGKTAAQMFDPKSPDYVGKGIKGPSESQINAALADFYTNGTLNSGNKKFNINDLDKVTDGSSGIKTLNAAIQSKNISKADAIKYARQRGWVQPETPKDNAPAVPLPKF